MNNWEILGIIGLIILVKKISILPNSKIPGTFPRWWFQICFIFTPIPGEIMQFDEHILQRG